MKVISMSGPGAKKRRERRTGKKWQRRIPKCEACLKAAVFSVKFLKYGQEFFLCSGCCEKYKIEEKFRRRLV